MLIIVCGLPGTGKSTLAAALAKRRGAELLSSDVIRKRMFPAPSYSEEEKSAVYEEMARACEKALAEGKGVVADATFYKKRLRDRFRSIAEAAGTRAFFILCVIEERKAEERMGARGRSGPSDADFEVHLRMKRQFEPIGDAEGGHLEIDAGLPLGTRLRMAESHVGGKGG